MKKRYLVIIALFVITDILVGFYLFRRAEGPMFSGGGIEETSEDNDFILPDAPLTPQPATTPGISPNPSSSPFPKPSEKPPEKMFPRIGSWKLSRTERASKLREAIKALETLHSPKKSPGPRDWLTSHPEQGQTFEQYLTCKPIRPTRKRSTIYIQPLGEFSGKQKEILDGAAEFLSIYFCLNVKICASLPVTLVPQSDRRTAPWGTEQLRVGYILKTIMWPRLPKDAAAYICFTTMDLWPGEGWNFVFGTAYLRYRIAVWSIHRFGNPESSKDEYRLALLRTIKIASHETGHMFTIQHCTKWECNMGGSNSMQESDVQPLALCPECMAKICWNCQAHPVKRYRRLTEFCRGRGLDCDAAFFRKSADALKDIDFDK